MNGKQTTKKSSSSLLLSKTKHNTFHFIKGSFVCILSAVDTCLALFYFVICSHVNKRLANKFKSHLSNLSATRGKRYDNSSFFYYELKRDFIITNYFIYVVLIRSHGIMCVLNENKSFFLENITTNSIDKRFIFTRYHLSLTINSD